MARPVFVLALAFACCACNKPPAPAPATTTPTASALSVTGVHFFGEDNGKAGGEVAKFDYRQKDLFFAVNLSQTVKNATGRWVFFAKETAVGNNQEIQRLEGKIDGNAMTAQINLKGRPWPVGTYHVQILLDDQPVGDFDYDVTGETTAITFNKHSFSADINGKPGAAVASFKPSDRTMHVQVTTTGIDTTEPEVVWHLIHLKDGKEIEMAQTQQPPMKLQDSVLTCQFTSKVDWEKGDYRADVYVSGKKAHSIPIQVK